MTATGAKPMKSTKKPAKAKKLPAPKKAALLAGKIEELRESRRVLNVSTLEWQEAHTHAAELKKTMEKNQARLNGICSDIDSIESGNYTPSLPFGETKAETNGHASPESWRGVALSTLGLEKKILDCLADAKLTTIGAIADYSKFNRMTDVKGIGDVGAETIENALTEYWKAHPQEPEATPEANTNGEEASNGKTIFNQE